MIDEQKEQFKEVKKVFGLPKELDFIDYDCSTKASKPHFGSCKVLDLEGYEHKSKYCKRDLKQVLPWNLQDYIFYKPSEGSRNYGKYYLTEVGSALEEGVGNRIRADQVKEYLAHQGNRVSIPLTGVSFKELARRLLVSDYQLMIILRGYGLDKQVIGKMVNRKVVNELVRKNSMVWCRLYSYQNRGIRKDAEKPKKSPKYLRNENLADGEYRIRCLMTPYLVRKDKFLKLKCELIDSGKTLLLEYPSKTAIDQRLNYFTNAGYRLNLKMERGQVIYIEIPGIKKVYFQ